VEVAACGLEALQLLRAQRFDLVLLDLVMPKLDGYQVLTRMKSDPGLAEVPVIMISALDQVTGIARCIEAGAEDYLSKPFDPMLLQARVGAVLAKKRLRDAARVQLKQSALHATSANAGPAQAVRTDAGGVGEPLAAAAGEGTKSVTENKAVFLSYASQDADAAKRICEALSAAGIEVWFDRNELVGGDAWDAKIRKQIKECALFVPVVSAHSNARLEAYFRREWKLAVERTFDMAEEKAFLMPVVIDATSEATASVPGKFREVQWTRLPGGETPSAFGARLKALLAGVAGPEFRGPLTGA
jgi:CheY-like chemotaxis protein